MKARLVTLIAVLFSLYAQAQNDLKAKYPKTYKAIFTTINNLPETQEFLKSAKVSEPEVYVDGPSPSWRNYWWVKVGTGNFGMLRATYQLFVDPKTLHVYYLDDYDNGNGLNFKLITLQQWRKWRTTKAWKKTHRYKNGELVTQADR
ncbi:hypothetical protein [Mucilaginibacter psychrotolerans]|uniref:Uncharacterized protein n=1 Tax=Mucilaginibacter psychrotolerans TaxID=1524096 RepID=A0A4Y8S8V5_9SPHI|nr:hypothetical protein [Mucilaginibacter psychrotolerans]TFF34947.1 hypothetical protein E2R66_20470 [Mucilaginibacter psychrotolerans]